jgi:hypothetical protein
MTMPQPDYAGLYPGVRYPRIQSARFSAEFRSS